MPSFKELFRFKKTGSSTTQTPRTKVKRYNYTDPYFWIKIGGFLVFFAHALASIVYFEARYDSPFFAPKSVAGVGLFLTPIAWLLWFGALGRTKLVTYYINFGLASVVFIAAYVMSLGLASSITGALVLVLMVSTLIYRSVKPTLLPKPLMIKLNA